MYALTREIWPWRAKDPWWFLAGKTKKKGSKLQFAVALIALSTSNAIQPCRKADHRLLFFHCSSGVMVVQKLGRLSQQNNTIIMRDFNYSHLNCVNIITVSNGEIWIFFRHHLTVIPGEGVQQIHKSKSDFSSGSETHAGFG